MRSDTAAATCHRVISCPPCTYMRALDALLMSICSDVFSHIWLHCCIRHLAVSGSRLCDRHNSSVIHLVSDLLRLVVGLCNYTPG